MPFAPSPCHWHTVDNAGRRRNPPDGGLPGSGPPVRGAGRDAPHQGLGRKGRPRLPHPHLPRPSTPPHHHTGGGGAAHPRSRGPYPRKAALVLRNRRTACLCLTVNVFSTPRLLIRPQSPRFSRAQDQGVGPGCTAHLPPVPPLSALPPPLSPRFTPPAAWPTSNATSTPGSSSSASSPTSTSMQSPQGAASAVTRYQTSPGAQTGSWGGEVVRGSHSFQDYSVSDRRVGWTSAIGGSRLGRPLFFFFCHFTRSRGLWRHLRRTVRSAAARAEAALALPLPLTDHQGLACGTRHSNLQQCVCARWCRFAAAPLVASCLQPLISPNPFPSISLCGPPRWLPESESRPGEGERSGRPWP